MNIEIIAVGDEVVKGHTINSNAAYIAKRMSEYGMDTMYHTAVCDTSTAIKDALLTSLKRSECVFVVGGLGPTKDDITKETICDTLGQKMVYFESIYQDIQNYFSKTGRTTPEENKKQAFFPEDSIVLKNENGTAPGCILNYEHKYVILLPGPPKELIPMLEKYVVPFFRNKTKQIIHTESIHLFGIGESHLEEKIGDYLGVFEKHMVATYVGEDEVIIRIRSYGDIEEEVIKYTEEIKKNIANCLKEYIIGYNNSKIEEKVVELLKDKQLTIATAESCTGGMVASTLINCSGISQLLSESIVTYSNTAKIKYLNVKEETLNTFGAVSHETAKEMAVGIKNQANAHIGVATTGIAGPEGGTEAKPVGTVYIAIAMGDMCYTQHLYLKGNRQDIRQRTTKHIIYQLYKYLSQDNTCNYHKE